MTKFTQYTIETAPTAAKPLLEQARQAWGFLPTLHATLNYVNHLAHTPKESFMADPALAWVAPRNR